MPAPNAITAAQLNRLIGTPECPVIIDLCLPEDFAADPYVIPTATPHDFRDTDGLIQRLQGRRAVLYCQQGRKISQGVVAWLNSAGLAAEYLEGGMYAWREAAETQRVPAASLPTPVSGGSLWVTRHRPKIDRIACPWLIRRFVDPDARFLFVAPNEVAGVAERFGALPFDVEGVALSHHGDNCSFDAMLDHFEPHSQALDRLAEVIRAADTNQNHLHPVAAGLLALSVGLSRQYRNDTEQLSAGLPLYDALYRWARDGYEETHDWPRSGP